MAEPTPGPYEIHAATIIWSPSEKAVIAAASELRPSQYIEFKEASWNSKDFEQACTNAKFIATACNAHEALARELSLLLRLLEPYEQDGTLSERVPGLATLNGIREALRKAEVSASR